MMDEPKYLWKPATPSLADHSQKQFPIRQLMKLEVLAWSQVSFLTVPCHIVWKNFLYKQPWVVELKQEQIFYIYFHFQTMFLQNEVQVCTANVCRELQGLYREIGVQGFPIYGDCMYTHNPCNFEIPHSYFHCNICRKFDFKGILRGFPALDVGKPCNNLIFWEIPAKFAGITCKL